MGDLDSATRCSAHLVLFDAAETRTVRGAELPSRSKWSAFEGMELAGFPKVVVRRGEVVFRDGRTTVDAGGLPLDLEPVRSPGNRTPAGG